ncbi:MAG: hypothetical protein H6724_00270 [Sandaracinus sp.]|nr:hypothetical protein [Sandaracinus sp.]
MNLGIVVGAALGLGGVVASVVVQRRLEASLADASDSEAGAFDRAARQALVGVVLAMTLFFALPPGPAGLGATVGALGLNATVLFARRMHASPARRRLATGAWLASLAIFGGVALFLLSGGRASF